MWPASLALFNFIANLSPTLRSAWNHFAQSWRENILKRLAICGHLRPNLLLTNCATRFWVTPAFDALTLTNSQSYGRTFLPRASVMLCARRTTTTHPLRSLRSLCRATASTFSPRLMVTPFTPSHSVHVGVVAMNGSSTPTLMKASLGIGQ